MAPGGLAHRVQRTTSSPAAAATTTTTTTTTATHSWPPTPTTSASARSWGRRRLLRRRQRQSLTGTYVRKTKLYKLRKEVSFHHEVTTSSKCYSPLRKASFFSSALPPPLRPRRPRLPTPLRLPSLSPRRKSTLSSLRPRLRPHRPRRQRTRPTSSWTALTRSRTTLVNKQNLAENAL